MPSGPPVPSGSARFVSAQNHYSWLHRDPEADLVPALEQYGIGLLPYYPLANGLLTGKYRRGEAAGRQAPASPTGVVTDDLTDANFDSSRHSTSFAEDARRRRCSTSRSVAWRPSPPCPV